MSKDFRGIIPEERRKYVYPFLFSLTVIFLAFVFLSVLSSFDMGLAAFGLLYPLLVVIVVVLIPVYCVIYGKKCLGKEKKKIHFAFYNSAVITLFYLVPNCFEGETYLYSLILFGWCMLWTLLPGLFKK